MVARGDEHIFEAARRMRDQHVGCLVVVEDEDDGMHPIGVVTDLDLLLAIIGTGAEHVEGLRLAELMSWDRWSPIGATTSTRRSGACAHVVSAASPSSTMRACCEGSSPTTTSSSGWATGSQS